MRKRVQSPGLSLAFSAHEIEVARKERKLLSLDIELTKRCNLRCLYCYADAGEGYKEELGLNEVINIVDQARQLGLKTLNLTGGEPLLHKTYFEIAEYAHEHNISVLLFTNGTLITDKIARKLMDLGVAPCVKLDSLSSTVQDYLTGGKGVLQKIKKGIKNLINAGYTTKHSILSTNAVACRQNLSELPKLWGWARRQNIVPFLTRFQPMGRAKGRTDMMITPKELYGLYCRLSEVDKGFGITWEPKIPWVYGKACRRHYIGCFVDSHGNVQPCSGVPIKAGNLADKGLEEILFDSEVFEVARNLEDHMEGACRTCENRRECYGCRSIAYFTANRFTAADPLCWHNAELS